MKYTAHSWNHSTETRGNERHRAWTCRPSVTR